MCSFVLRWAGLPLCALLLSACSANYGVIDRENGTFDIWHSAYSQDSADQEILKLASAAATKNGRSRFTVLQSQTSVALAAGGMRTYTSNASVRLLRDEEAAPHNAKVFVVNGASAHLE